MNYAEHVLQQIAENIGKPYQTLEPFAQKLSQNFCDTKIALNNITVKELEAIGIPTFIAMKIKQQVSTPQQQQQSNLQNNNKQKIPSQQNHQDDIQQIKKKNLKFQVMQNFKELLNEYLTPKEKFQSLNVIYKVLNNILTNPKEQKFRALNLENKTLYQKLWKFRSSQRYLCDLGFRNSGNKMILQDNYLDLELLQFNTKLINHEMQRASQKMKNFSNPYDAKFSSNNPQFNIKEVGKMAEIENSKFKHEYEALKKQREELLKDYKVKRYIKIMHQQNVVPYIQEEDEKTEQYLNQQAQRKNLFDQIANFQKTFQKEQTFSNSRKKEFEAFMKQPLVLETQIKIKLPNRYIIQTNFGIHEKIKNLFELLDQYLIERNYYLSYSGFPKKQIKRENGSQTFKQMDLTPDGSLNLFYFDDNLNKMNSILLVKQIS